MPAFPASGILRQSDPTRHAGRFPQRSARTESAARFVQLERIWLMAIKPSLPLIQSSDAESPNQAAGELLLSTPRSEEHTSELQSLMRISYAVFCVKKKTNQQH